jgi:hypothetical protein
MIKAIETVYNGYRFRSRVEARWAVFFDTLGIEYEYEKEGYDLPSGRYLPDFWLPQMLLRTTASEDYGVWLEVKPIEPNDHEYAVATELGEGTKAPVVVGCGLPRSSLQIEDGMYEVWPIWDNYMLFMKCYACGRVKVEFLESNYCICESCGGICDEQHPMIIAAERAAKQARFEFGERGT